MKKQVIAYLHTHWDREWYREFEVFRLRLVRVFDNVLDLLVNNKIPSFYFDGQVSALLDYLEIRPEKENIVRQLISEKKLFIGPFYTLVDEFLTDRIEFEKNLEIGLKISRDFGCEDFIGYFADTFGHSKNIPEILKKFGIDKAVVWRGCGDIPSEFKFCGVDTVNLIRGYFMDIFSSKISIEDKAEWLKSNLDKIAEKSSDVLLLPIGADHLGIEPDIAEQIDKVNDLLEDYEIKLSSPFEYFDKVKDNFKNFEWNDELRDNSKTFILQGCYSARTKLKQLNTECSYMLEQADKIQKKYGGNYEKSIEYTYKLLLQNLAHDGICGCSTDDVHRENISRYTKVLQVANTIIEELRLEHGFKTPVLRSPEILDGYRVIKTEQGFADALLYDTQRIPVTEDLKTIYTLKKLPEKFCEISLEVRDGKLFANDVEIEFVRCSDKGDSYNFGAVADDIYEKAEILGLDGNIIKTSFFDVDFERGKNLLNFKIMWENKLKNKLWQVRFILPNEIRTTYSEDMNSLITRNFDCNYNMRENLPKERGIEVKTNFAPMQRYVGVENFGVITKGLTEYEVYKNTLAITILRSIGIISNPVNPSRSTPAGPPLAVPEAQQLGLNRAEFSIGFFAPKDYKKAILEVYPEFV